MLEKYWTVKRF